MKTRKTKIRAAQSRELATRSVIDHAAVRRSLSPADQIRRRAALALGAALILAALGTLTAEAADAGVIVQARVGGVVAAVSTQSCTPYVTAAARLQPVAGRVLVSRPARTFEPERSECGGALVIGHLPARHQLVWVPGHFAKKAHGRRVHRVWVPGHWRRL